MNGAGMIGAFCNVSFILHFWGFPGQLGFLGWLLALCCWAFHWAEFCAVLQLMGLLETQKSNMQEVPPKQ